MDVFKQFDQEYGEGATDPVAQEVRQHTSSEEDEELLEIDKCLSKAVYYKAIVRDGVLQDDGSSEVAEINAEVKMWARQQMARLVGRGPLAQPPAPQATLFSESQVSILREIADRVLASKGVTQAPAPKVRQLQTQPLRKPIVTQQRTTMAPAPAPQKKPAKPGPKPTKQPQLFVPSRTNAGKIDYAGIPLEQAFRDEDGQLYKFVPHPQKDNTRVKIKVTNQVRNTASVPFPTTKQGMESLSRAQAMDTLNAGGSGNSIFSDEKSLDPRLFVAAAAGALANQDKDEE